MSQSSKSRPEAPAFTRHGLGMLLFALLLVTFNLRGAITGVGPVLPDIQAQFGLSSALAGFLTTLPLFAFAFISPVGSPLARKIGMERAILLALVLIIAGLLVRYITTVTALYAGMALIGIGVAIGNVVVPGLVRRDFPERLTLVTAFYTMAIVTSGGLGSGITVPLATEFGWPNSLFIWIVPAILGLLIWLPQLRNTTRPSRGSVSALAGSNVWRSPLAWQVTLFMGFQATGFYTYIAWFPSIMAEFGVGAAAAGWLLFIFQIVILISTMVVPVLISRTNDQRWIGFGCGVGLVIGYLGLYLNPDWVTLWLIIAGAGSGGSLVFALTMFGLRASSPQQTVALSGMAQAVGYFLSAIIPVILGLLRDITHSWALPLLLMVGVAVLHTLFGWLSGRDRKIDG